MANDHPFPFDDPGFDASALKAACAALLGGPTEFRVGARTRLPAPQWPAHLEPLVALWLEHPAAGRVHSLLLALSSTDAAQLVQLALGGPESLAARQDRSAAVDAFSAGALMYVAARLLADSGATFTLRGLMQGQAAVSAAIGGSDVYVSDVQVTLGTRVMAPKLLYIAPASRDELRVELDAGLTVSTGDVVVLAPGALPGAVAMGEYATLRADGRVVADGEIVDVAGETGVRVDRVMR